MTIKWSDGTHFEPYCKADASFEFNVTIEMIDAAFSVWIRSGASDYATESDKAMLHDIIIAALRTLGPVHAHPDYANRRRSNQAE